MKEAYAKILRKKMDDEQFAKLEAIENDKLHKFVAESVELADPDSVFVATDDPKDVQYIRELAIKTGEEKPLAIKGHTIHYDGYYDQGRDKARTKFLLPKGVSYGKRISSIEKEEATAEVLGLFKGSMKGRQALLRLFCLGIPKSVFAVRVVQLTDSAYVGHSEDMLYRTGYEEFKRAGKSEDFFRILHSSGRVGPDMCSVDVDKRRIYQNLEDEIVYSVNTQYAGNTVGLKKLSLRLAIRKAAREGWLAEHMFIMGVHGPQNRVTYMLGAFPSACGKTSTAMVPGQTIVGDDLAYLRKVDGEVRTVNVERGIFGIISDVNSQDDPLIWELLHKPGQVIFSNVLVKDGKPYWLNMGEDVPESGFNHSGEWQKGKKDKEGKEIPHAHKNARYTVRIDDLGNRDEKADDPAGVMAGTIIYGGRDSDTCVPVEESFDWAHGVITKGASIESETTAATLGQEGVRKFSLMSNLDFLSMPLGQYINAHLGFAKGIKNPPRIYSVNYFLKGKDGGYLNDKLDKMVWLQWMERRCHGEMDGIKTPTGIIPKYDDLVKLFKEYRKVDYSKEDYAEQFKIRIPELLSKNERITNIYKEEEEVPAVLFETLAAQKKRLEELKAAKGDYVSPFDL